MSSPSFNVEISTNCESSDNINNSNLVDDTRDAGARCVTCIHNHCTAKQIYVEPNRSAPANGGAYLLPVVATLFQLQLVLLLSLK